MKILKNLKFRNYLAALSLVTLLASCDKNDAPAPVGDNLDKLITNKSNLSLFSAALTKTRLTTFTQGGGPYTVWAPTNAAFNAIGITTAADLNNIDSNLLVQLLTYHIQATSRSFTEIPQGPNATMTTQGGFTQYASRYVGGFAFINGAKVSEPNIQASNGFLHIIDRVLVPPYNTNATNLALNPNYKQFLQAITKTATAITANPYTILAVPNNVMTAAGYDSATIATASGAALTTLTGIIRYHLVAQRIFSPDFKAGNLKTVQGTNLVISLTGGVNIKGTNNPAPFQITIPDVLSSNGVIHAINGLLKP
ncbi:MAG: fasciclin domain-containing protein [Ferruginibacter sp.]